MAEERSEPSMEAILSSIKKIIAEDDRVAPRVRAARATAPRKDETPGDAADDDVLELTQTAEELLDDEKAQSLAQSFSVLKTLSEPGAAPQIVRSGETSLEGLTRELLRPMLKEWLDANLPAMVEALVAREIERIAKKG
jgi:cell pole-organizing protein PopZ